MRFDIVRDDRIRDKKTPRNVVGYQLQVGLSIILIDLRKKVVLKTAALNQDMCELVKHREALTRSVGVWRLTDDGGRAIDRKILVPHDHADL